MQKESKLRSALEIEVWPASPDYHQTLAVSLTCNLYLVSRSLALQTLQDRLERFALPTGLLSPVSSSPPTPWIASSR